MIDIEVPVLAYLLGNDRVLLCMMRLKFHSHCTTNYPA